MRTHSLHTENDKAIPIWRIQNIQSYLQSR